MADDGRHSDEGCQVCDNGRERRRYVHVRLGNAGVARDEPTQRAERVHEGVIRVQDPVAFELYGPHLDDLVPVGVEAGRLQVQGYPGFFQGRGLFGEEGQRLAWS